MLKYLTQNKKIKKNDDYYDEIAENYVNNQNKVYKIYKNEIEEDIKNKKFKDIEELRYAIKFIELLNRPNIIEFYYIILY